MLTAILASTLLGALIIMMLPEGGEDALPTGDRAGSGPDDQIARRIGLIYSTDKTSSGAREVVRSTRWKNDILIKWVAAVSSGVAFILSGALFWQFERGVPGFQFVERVPWIPSLGVTYALGVDGVGLVMVLLTGIVIFTGVLISCEEFRTGSPNGLMLKVGRPKEFFALLLVLVTGVFGVFMSLDLFWFFLFYELAVLPMYLLIGIWGTSTKERAKEYSAMKLTIYLLLGSAFILLGILAMYFQVTPHTFDLERLAAAGFPARFQTIFYPVLFIGFGILAGLWPFHTWSPDGHAAAPSSVSMLHAGVLMKLGAFGIIRVALGLLPEGARVWAYPFALLTIVNIVYGALSAMSQRDLKYVIAYSSVSHMGIVLLGICSLNLLSLDGAVFQMFAHGVMTGLFFALVGTIYSRTHTRALLDMGGLAARMPFLCTAFVIGGLSSLGLPGLSGFVAEFTTFLGSFRTFPILTLVAATGVVFTALYVLRVVQWIFFGPIKNPHFEQLPDAAPLEKAALAILAACLVLFGAWPNLLMEPITGAVATIVTRWSVG